VYDDALPKGASMTDSKPHSPFGLENHGLRNLGPVHWNLNQAALTEHAIRKGEGFLSAEGPLVVKTGQHTGRSANDKFVVRDENTENEIWWGKVNVPYKPDQFDALFARMIDYLEGKELLRSSANSSTSMNTSPLLGLSSFLTFFFLISVYRLVTYGPFVLKFIPKNLKILEYLLRMDSSLFLTRKFSF
jgi:hypothetical protein